MRNVSFGILTSVQSLQYESIRDTWREAESCGFESAWLPDHFLPYDLADRSIMEPVLECWVTLSALARDTNTIRLGPLVSCNSFRPPALLAKMAASLDVISGGRLNFGIGAGWMQLEHQAYGYPFPKTSKRIKRLGEALDIVKRMWSEERPTYKGSHYEIVGAANNPKPVQKPHPPIYIGAAHERTIRFAAERADVWNFPSDVHPVTATDYKQRTRIIENRCTEIERDPKSVRRSWLGTALLGTSKGDLEERISRLKPKSMSRELFLRGIVGTADEAIQRMREYVDLGVSEFILKFPDVHSEGCLREFYSNVIEQF
jgi:F420-dependent oxidoreductase-like protein